MKTTQKIMTSLKIFLIVSLLFAALTAVAQKPSTGGFPTLKYEKYRLPNGLEVILSEDHAAPTYSIAVTYNVGSRDERDGRTGFAHLFEHMMFQGSQNVGKGEHFVLI